MIHMYSPVVEMQTTLVVTLLFILNANVLSEVYVRLQGCNDHSYRVNKLNKALYTSKESERDWYEYFNAYIDSMGFRSSKYYYCIYVKVGNNVTM